MSISSALNNAASGLAASSRLADTIANNVANAMTVGYARRTTELSSLTARRLRLGVKVTGTYRAENAFLTAERRAHGRLPRRDRHRLGHLRADHGGGRRAGRRQRALDARDRARDDADVGDRLAAVDDQADRRGRRRRRTSPPRSTGSRTRTSRLRTEADAEIARQVERGQRRAARASTTSTRRSPRWRRRAST